VQVPPVIEELTRALRGRPRRVLSLPGFRESAVLVPLVWEDGAVRLLLTVRHAALPTHAGQVAFPGGKRDEGDTSLEDTALREAAEELGLPGGPGGTTATVLGLLDDVPTPSGFVITPVVAALRGPLVLQPSEREVTEVFYAPLPALRGVHRRGPEVAYMGVSYVMHEYPFERWRIWGATANMVDQLLRLWPEDPG
jgi:8-oxo-dGTP pyrophosphatase MutT (NUDIX family)